MKILIIRSFPSLIDLKSNSYNQQEIGLAKAILSLGHQAGIVYYGENLSRDDVYDTNEGKVNIYYRKAKVLLKRVAFYESFNNLKEEYDFLILNEYDQFETYKTLKKYSEKSIIYHGPYYASFNKKYNMYNKIYDILFLNTIRKISPRIYTKSKMAQEFLEKKGLSVVDYVGVGLDESQLQLNENLEATNNSNKINMLYVGKIEARRNVDFLIMLLSRLLQNKNKEYQLTIIGTGEPCEVDKMKGLAKKLNICKSITYIERLEQKELPMVYKANDIFLLPTSYEIWGMVLMEAMKFDLPILTTYNGGSSSLIKSGVNGFVLDLELDKWVDIISNLDLNLVSMHEYNQQILDVKCNWKTIAKKMLATEE